MICGYAMAHLYNCFGLFVEMFWILCGDVWIMCAFVLAYLLNSFGLLVGMFSQLVQKKGTYNPTHLHK